MELADLKLKLEAIASQRSKLAEARAEYSGFPPHIAEKIAIADLAQDISALLESDPKLQGLMIREGNGAKSFVIGASRRMVFLALTETSDAAIAWLGKVRQLKSAEAFEILPLWGINVEAPINLLHDAELLPFESLPDSPQKNILVRLDFGDAHRPSYALKSPTAALVTRQTIDPLYCQIGDGNYERMTQLGNSERLSSICRVLSTIAPAAIIPAISWIQFADGDIDFSLLGYSYSNSLMEIQPSQLRSCGDFSGSEAQIIVRKYFEIQPSNPKINLALDRFDRAMRRHDAGDSIVELAVSLESLLGDGNMELGWKLSFRSALLIEGSPEQKLEIRNIIREIYRLRGQVVHKGITPPESKEFLPSASAAAAKVIKAAIEKGLPSNWFKAELGY